MKILEIKTIILFLVILLKSYYTFSQNCGCDYVISAGGYAIDGASLNIKPGDTICLTANRGGIAFRNIQGTESSPVVIMNCGQKVSIATTASYGVKFERCKNFKLTGTGSQDEYGIEVSGSYHGVYLGDFSTNFELDHVEVHDTGFEGIMAKTDPACNDSNTWRQNFVMQNINIHHNYVHTTGGEGFYIGYSFYANGISCNGFTAYPHSIENIKVHHNKTFNTSCEGIQVGCAIKGCEIYSNLVENFGQKPFATGQENGIQIGEGTGGLCYNNIVKAGGMRIGGNGIIVLGIGDNVVFNNLISNTVGCGIFMDERPPAIISGSNSAYRIINNTIVNSGTEGIKSYAEIIGINEIKNNVIVNPGNGKYVSTQGGPGTPRMLVGNNYSTMDVTAMKFVNDTSDYHLKSTSPCIDKAENGAHWNILFDHTNLIRPKGIGFDIGAFEFDTSLVNQPPVVNAGRDTTIKYPLDSIMVTGSVSDLDGWIDVFNWSKNPNDSLIIENEKLLTIKIKKLHLGTNIIRLNAVDNGNKSAYDEVTVIVQNANLPPVVNAGKDTVIVYPKNTITLKGIASDSDGSITTYLWTQIEGGTAVLTTNNTSSITVSNLSPGRSVFRLTVTDNNGAVANDDIIVFVNYPPTVNAGADKIATNTDNVINLTGTANDQDGTIASIVWTKVSGPAATINNSTNLSASIVGFIGGTYLFRLTVTDDKGTKASDDIQIFVNSAPIVNLGNDRVQSTTQNTSIQATVSDPNGNTMKLLWTKISGPTVTMTNTTSNLLNLSNLKYGVYVFRLTATDSYGASSFDEITLRINTPPTAVAGPDLTIRLPQNSITVDGSKSTDPDGTIASYTWTKLYGPSAVMQNTTSPVLKLSGLSEGTYVFRLQVKDNYSAMSQDDVAVKVRK